MHIFVPVLRKYYNFLFLLFAQLLILGHSVVAHHHHVNTTANRHHNGRKETPLESVLSGITHFGEHVSFTHSSETKIVVLKVDAKSIKALPVNYFTASFQYVKVFRKNIFPPYWHIIKAPPLYGANSLRGPPSFITA
ncbi:hypothetical protein OZ666_11065 [Elizabethkingia sp. HX QKY]|uniref:hypothetical protein n=1 Tax=Elizabethkingia TaxID=308865 RepID=UPI002A240185|nr:hypothetical protein [Elizabethkingia sp. HX QKY]MDX8572223.1 hypothetical protein [Elizabethkingia sp. HX QKY]